MQIFHCPICFGVLTQQTGVLRCANMEHTFPIVEGIPILINEARSLFRIQDFVQQKSTFFPTQTATKRFFLRFVPSLSNNILARRNYQRIAKMLLQQKRVQILVIGGGIVGNGMVEILQLKNASLIETDVAFGPRTQVVCDAHDLPFANNTFDLVIAQAVLEHVVDPWRCSQEIRRVLKDGGLVYAETPFMQQVHGGRYDFTRFTYEGHRRLFDWCTEVDSGATCGTGMALAWSYEYFLLSMTRHRFLQRCGRLFARYTAWWLKYIDYLTIHTPGTRDAASGFFFLGRKK